METLRRALAWEDEQRAGGALQLVIAIILAGLISVTALGFGIAFLLGAGDEATSKADNPAGTWILLAMGVGVAVGAVVALRRQARRWEAAHGPAEPTVPLRWRPALWAGAIGEVALVGALSLLFGEGLYAAIAFATVGVAGLVVAVFAARRWMRSRSTGQDGGRAGLDAGGSGAGTGETSRTLIAPGASETSPGPGAPSESPSTR